MSDTDTDHTERSGTLHYSNNFEERGSVSGMVEPRVLMGYEMLSVTREDGSESLFHFRDVERIDYDRSVDTDTDRSEEGER